MTGLRRKSSGRFDILRRLLPEAALGLGLGRYQQVGAGYHPDLLWIAPQAPGPIPDVAGGIAVCIILMIALLAQQYLLLRIRQQGQAKGLAFEHGKIVASVCALAKCGIDCTMQAALCEKQAAIPHLKERVCAAKTLINNLKTASARRARNRYREHLDQFYSKPFFWHRAYFVASTGQVAVESVRRYIQAQGSKEHLGTGSDLQKSCR